MNKVKELILPISAALEIAIIVYFFDEIRYLLSPINGFVQAIIILFAAGIVLLTVVILIRAFIDLIKREEDSG